MSSVPHRASRSRLLPIAVAIASILQTACSAAPQLGDELGVDEQAASVAGTSCSAPQLAVEVRGTVLTLTASATCGSAPEYRFSIQAPGSTVYSEFQPYSTLNSLQTDLAGAWSGRYAVLVHVRDSGSFVRYDAWASSSFLLGSVCTAASVSASPNGSTTDLAATATCGGADAEYRFLVRAPGATAFTELRGWGGPTHAWNTSGLAGAGRYDVIAYARAAGNWSTYEAYATTTTMVGAVCTAATLDASPNGSTTDLTASATCGGADAEYRFLARAPGTTAFTELRGWGGSSYAWDTTDIPVAGRYDVVVYARAVGHSSAYEAYATAAANVGTVCSAGALSATPNGSTVALAASATCGQANAEYRFFVRPPGASSFAELRGWGSAEYGWDVSALSPGTYTLLVYARVEGGASAYETYAAKAFAVR